MDNKELLEWSKKVVEYLEHKETVKPAESKRLPSIKLAKEWIFQYNDCYNHIYIVVWTSRLWYDTDFHNISLMNWNWGPANAVLQLIECKYDDLEDWDIVRFSDYDDIERDTCCDYWIYKDNSIYFLNSDWFLDIDIEYRNYVYKVMPV